jgi:phage terminase small subunit
MADTLPPKQQRFVALYLADPQLNATRAYMDAYGSKNEQAAAVSAARLLRNAKVQAEIAEAQAERSERVQVNQDYVLSNLTEVVERCMQRAPVMVRQGKHVVQAQDEDGNDIWQFDANGAVKALNLLGQHLGLYTKKVDHTSGGAPLRFTLKIGDASIAEASA